MPMKARSSGRRKRAKIKPGGDDRGSDHQRLGRGVKRNGAIPGLADGYGDETDGEAIKLKVMLDSRK